MTNKQMPEKSSLPEGVAIRVQNLGKRYEIYHSPKDRLKQYLWGKKKQYFQEFWALRDLELEIRSGESIGILGVNGAGKSTLLQLLSGILTPTEGEVSRKGRVVALLELGTGFNPEWSGHENIYLNGTVLGLSKEEINEKYDDIISFAEIGDFINQPVKLYSSGMYLRLAFAIAVNVDPDILIIDEALAVGDTRFQQRCINRMEEIHEKGATILFVSHAVDQIKRFCSKALWLHKGRCKMFGDANETVDAYRNSLHLEQLEQKQKNEEKRTDEKKKTKEETKNRETSTLPAYIKKASISKSEVKTFDNVNISLHYRVNDLQIPKLLVGVALYDREGKYLFGPNTYLDKYQIPETQGEHTVTYSLEKIPLLSGTYFIDVGIFTNGGMVCLDFLPKVLSFEVRCDFLGDGLIHLPHKWEVTKDSGNKSNKHENPPAL